MAWGLSVVSVVVVVKEMGKVCTFLEKGVFVVVGICTDVVEEGFSVC